MKREQCIGKLLFKLGFDFKTSIKAWDTTSLSFGYGKLGCNGYWKYPIFFPKGEEVSRTTINFKGKNQTPLLMIIREDWLEGKVVWATCLFSIECGGKRIK